MTTKLELVERGYKLLETGTSDYTAILWIINEAIALGESKASAKDTTDWHNMTAAIKSGEPIDWEALDGWWAKCEHEDMGALVRTMKRSRNGRSESYVGWLDKYDAWYEAFVDAWQGVNGWTLYIDGPVPMKRKTADKLKPGTFFMGLHRGREVKFVVFETTAGGLLARPLYGSNVHSYLAESVEVIEEYGIGTLKAGDGEV